SMRYGTVPVVHAVGGLADTVRDAVPVASTRGRGARAGGTGFAFAGEGPAGLLEALTRGLPTFGGPPKGAALPTAGVQQEFSWDRSAAEYVKVYDRVLKNTG